MHRLFCLMGKSASGKDTIYKRLLEDSTLPLKRVVPYTTRPIRVKEENGREYCFVTEQEYRELRDGGKIIEERCYHTACGDWYYFTADDGQIRLSGSSYLMIVTPEAYRALKARFGRAAVVPLLITLDEGERLERALRRERKQPEPKYEEMCRRSLADAADFSAEKLTAAGIAPEDTFLNEDLDLCTRQIHDRIAELLEE